MFSRRLSVVLCAALMLFQVTARAQNTFGWAATTNEDLYSEALKYLKTFQNELTGDPAYYMAQQLREEMAAVHPSDPYAWMTQIHNFCSKLEAIYSPSLSHPKVTLGAEDRYDRIRHQIVRMRDFPMHEVSLTTDYVAPAEGQVDAFHAANKQWLQHKREEVFRFLRSPRPTGDELQIAKIYSSGVVLRTKDACIGIDICYGEGMYDDKYKEELADMLDVLYVTHAHGDHFDLDLFRMMMKKGKAVVGPSTMNDRYFKNDVGDKHFWADTHLEPELIGGVATTQAYMSGQGDEPCLLYLIQIGDWRISHVGDNSDHRKEALIYPLFDMVDVSFSPVFQGVRDYLNNTGAAPNPKNIENIYINIHENEWHHTIEGRVSYRFLYTHAGALNNGSFVYPCVGILDNGEHITLYK